MTRWIGLLDCNNFFVSCERLFRPDLWGKPVVVLSSNDGCIVARSQEVKDMNVPMGVPYFQVKDSLQQAGTTVFSSHFALYRDLSRRVFAVMQEEVAQVEQYSIDEAFFLVESADPLPLARRVRAAVEQRVGIPVSIGLASSKTLAKQANARAKKTTGLQHFDQTTWRAVAASTPLGAVWGVGGRLELRYRAAGLETAADLMAADPARVARRFGVAGVRLQRELWGEVVYPVSRQQTAPKSLVSSRSFQRSTSEYAVLADAVAYHVRHLAADIRRWQLGARRLRVSIRPSRHGDFLLRGGSTEAVLPGPSNDTMTLLQTAHTLLAELYEAGVPYQKAGVHITDFAPPIDRQPTLFGSSVETVRDRTTLWQMIDGLNERSGRELITVGSRRRTQQWQPRCARRSPAYTTRWSQLATARSA
ncbi:MAG: Y-family DNA polymerase [Patescibacteria group bacterium]